MGIVYVYRNRDSRDYPNNYTGISCGEVTLGCCHLGQFARLQVPPGPYWLRVTGPTRLGATVENK